MPNTAEILRTGAALCSGERATQHGTDKYRNHWNIAQLWNAYLAIRREPAAPLTASDVCHMEALLKMARTQYGAFNADDWVDGAVYFAMGGETAEGDHDHGAGDRPRS